MPKIRVRPLTDDKDLFFEVDSDGDLVIRSVARGANEVFSRNVAIIRGSTAHKLGVWIKEKTT